MRTLVVAFEYPWPTTSGSRIRLLTTVRALARAGPVDLFGIVPTDRTDFGEPDPGLPVRTGRLSVGPVRLVPATLGHPVLPAPIPARHRRTVRRSLARFASGTYDVIWYFDVKAWLLAGGLAGTPEGGLAGTPEVLDLNDLEDEKIRARLSVPPSRASPGDAPWGPWPGRAWSRLEARRWSRLYRRASGAVAGTVVCSALDAGRATSAGVRRVMVVDNAYPRPPRPVGRESVGSPPTVLFPGTMRYPPNVEGARWLVTEIAPLLRSEVPEARVRLAGSAGPMVESLRGAPGVTIVGPVEAMTSELERADVVVVPVRYGSGTRLKILEAFAHRVPVVSTTFGAEGLAVQDGRHLLVADSAPAVAEACRRVLTDLPLRRRLVQAAHELYLGMYQEDQAFAQVDTVLSMATGAP